MNGFCQVPSLKSQINMWSVKTFPKVRFSKSTLLILEFEAEIISISLKVVTSIAKK
jgi:hypothetical protein